MKKVLHIITGLMVIIIIAGCSSSNEVSELENQENESNTSIKVEDQSTEEDNTDSREVESSEIESGDGKLEDIQLQMSKADADAGVKEEDSEIYQVLREAIEADPQVGHPNDVTLYPYDDLIDANGQRTILFLAVNRLPNSISNLVFNLTYGIKDGEYIWENQEVSIREEQIGFLKSNHAVPFTISITEEQKAIFDQINLENVDMRISDFTKETAE